MDSSPPSADNNQISASIFGNAFSTLSDNAERDKSTFTFNFFGGDKDDNDKDQGFGPMMNLSDNNDYYQFGQNFDSDDSRPQFNLF